LFDGSVILSAYFENKLLLIFLLFREKADTQMTIESRRSFMLLNCCFFREEADTKTTIESRRCFMLQIFFCFIFREEAERKGREMAMLVAELQRMRAETSREAVLKILLALSFELFFYKMQCKNGVIFAIFHFRNKTRR
jgi:hypothetical protein